VISIEASTKIVLLSHVVQIVVTVSGNSHDDTTECQNEILSSYRIISIVGGLGGRFVAVNGKPQHQVQTAYLNFGNTIHHSLNLMETDDILDVAQYHD
jgi:hypothetical protein